ncbi:MAG: lysozyme inhibitor LprI family protein [Alphaproteobacteria bacterium]
MNRLLLALSLTLVEWAYGAQSMLIAQTRSEASPSASATASASDGHDTKPQVLKTSPSGMFRVLQDGEDFWIVTAADEKQRTKMHSAELVTPEEFRFSPDEKWLYVELHHGSCMSGADLYRRNNANAAKPNDTGPFQVIEPSLEDGAWAEALKQRLFKENFADQGLCAMVRFGAWSDDSGRLLLILRGGEERREMIGRYLYYNTRTNAFELTPYLRKINVASAKSHDIDVLACAEPVDPLPDEATLKQRYNEVDKKLNDNYQKMIAKTEKENVADLRRSQRDWLKARDAGLKIYLAAFPPAEKERRRLQFLIDVSRVKAEADEEAAMAQ